MALTNPQGKLIIPTAQSLDRFDVVNGILSTSATNLDIVTTNLISYWGLEESSVSVGGIKDTAFTKYGVGANPENHCTRSGTAPFTTTGLYGAAATTFSGDDSIVSTATAIGLDAVSGSSQFTYEVWVRNAANLDSNERWIFQVQSGGNYVGMIALTSSNIVPYYGGSSNPIAFGSTTWNNNMWNQLVMTFINDGSSNAAKLYVNGALVTQSTPGAQATVSNSTVHMGQFYQGSGPIAIDLDEVKAYNRSLSGAEVLQNYNAYI